MRLLVVAPLALSSGLVDDGDRRCRENLIEGGVRQPVNSDVPLVAAYVVAERSCRWPRNPLVGDDEGAKSGRVE